MDALDKQLRDLRMSEMALGMEADELAQLIDHCKWQLEVEDVNIMDISSLDIHELIRGGPYCMTPSSPGPATPLVDTSSN